MGRSIGAGLVEGMSCAGSGLWVARMGISTRVAMHTWFKQKNSPNLS